ncbi:MAG: metal ABC transporter substrate-binding protein [Tissierellia bacterium]|nr:metal ABC transporter substrate-binding protein [Tissierellia bacterium]
MNKKLLTLVLALVVLLTACGPAAGNVNGGEAVQAEAPEAGGPLVVVTTFVLEDLARTIAGDHAEVVSLLPSGLSPHDFELGPKEMNLALEADLLIYNGAGLEPWMDKLLGQLDGEETRAVEAAEGVALMEGHSHAEDAEHEEHGEAHDEDAEHDEHEEHGEAHEEHDHGTMDPHIWLDPKNAVAMAEVITAALEGEDPQNAQDYRANFEELKGALEELDQRFVEGLKNAKTRDIVVNHEAFGYLAQAYNLKQRPIEGINSQSEPDPQTMAEIVAFVRENEIKTIFTEPLKDPKIAETIAAETGATVSTLDPLEGLGGGEELGYIELMEKNLEALKEGLGV